MSELSPEEAISQSQVAIGIDAAIPAQAWRIQRLDLPGEAYFLVVFGEKSAAITVIVIDAKNGEIKTFAHLPGLSPHLTVDAEQAIALAGVDNGAQASLVWQPCRASRSPLYALWQIRTATETIYVDQQGIVWHELTPVGPGG
jgi:hypothetical protein